MLTSIGLPQTSHLRKHRLTFFYVTKMPLSKAELAENVEFNRYAFKIVKEILAENDKALVANLLDFSKKVIVSCQNLTDLISIVLDNVDIQIATDVESKTCNCKCCKVKTALYENIESITVNGEDIFEKEKELCRYISNELGISLDKTYASQVIMIEKAKVADDEESEEEEEVEEEKEDD